MALNTFEEKPESFAERIGKRPDMPGDRPEIKSDYLSTILAAGICVVGGIAYILNKKKGGPER